MFWSSPLDTPGSVQNGITNLLFKETANENKLGLKAGHLSAVKDNPGFLRMKLQSCCSNYHVKNKSILFILQEVSL